MGSNSTSLGHPTCSTRLLQLRAVAKEPGEHSGRVTITLGPAHTLDGFADGLVVLLRKLDMGRFCVLLEILDPLRPRDWDEICPPLLAFDSSPTTART